MTLKDVQSDITIWRISNEEIRRRTHSCDRCSKDVKVGQTIMSAYELGEQYCHSDYCVECAIEVLKSVKDDADRLIKELEELNE